MLRESNKWHTRNSLESIACMLVVCDNDEKIFETRAIFLNLRLLYILKWKLLQLLLPLQLFSIVVIGRSRSKTPSYPLLDNETEISVTKRLINIFIFTKFKLLKLFVYREQKFLRLVSSVFVCMCVVCYSTVSLLVPSNGI